MVKSNVERQKKYRANLAKDKLKFEQMKQKSRMRDNTRRKNLTGDALNQLRIRQKQASKKYRDGLKLKRLNDNQSSTYKSRQSLGKAIKRAQKSLPKEPNKRITVVRHIAQTLDIIPRTTNQQERQQRQLPIELKQAVINFYNRDDISHQMPGKRDHITIKDENGSTTLQKRILLNSIRGTYELFLIDRNITNDALSVNSFRTLRPLNVLTYSHMPHHSCLCSYHENVNLLLKPLSKCINNPNLVSLQSFSKALVCNEDDENCMFNRCSLCANYFNDKFRKYVLNPAQKIQWYQWVFKNGYSEKQEFNGTIHQCLNTLEAQLESFLIHVFIKRRQATYFEMIKSISDKETICVQVDYSENFRLEVQDAVQGSFYTKKAVSLFTCYAWSLDTGYSFVYVSNNLSHDKYCITAALDDLFDKLKIKFNELKEVHVFSDGAAQQFKQKFLFRNLCRLFETFDSWHFFATSHGKGVVDGIGGSIKRLVYRSILSGQKCTSAADFITIARSKTNNIELCEIEQYRIDNAKIKLERIFQSLKSVPETKKIHSVKVLSNNSIEHKYYSSSLTKKTHRFEI
ncbi:unnamed protein product [Rotaria sp. Silwood2]|nr:unnamed protein product [Rotaria sp. Silwood2]CAF4175048.1 unnamed protein product [Rotaria sp. Silwood2]